MFGPAIVTDQNSTGFTTGDELMIWNSDLSVEVEIRFTLGRTSEYEKTHLSPSPRCSEWKIYHLVLRGKDAAHLWGWGLQYLHWTKISAMGDLQMINYVPFSKTVGLTYASGALTATWAKLRELRDQGIDQRIDKQTSISHLDEPRRHSTTPTLGYTSLQRH